MYLAAALLLSVASPAAAQTVWIGGGTNRWSTATNWSTGTAPGAADTASINDVTGGLDPCNLTTNETVDGLLVGSTATGQILNCSTASRSLTVDNTGITVGSATTSGTINVSAASVVLQSQSGGLAVAAQGTINVSADSTIDVDAGGLTVSGTVAYTAAGTLTIDAGGLQILSGGNVSFTTTSPVPTFTVGGGGLTVNGSLTLAEGMTVNVTGGVTLGSGGTLTGPSSGNPAIINIHTGDWTNNGATIVNASNITLVFKGSSDQVIGGTAATQVGILKAENTGAGGKVTLNNTDAVTSTVDLSASAVEINDGQFSIATDARADVSGSFKIQTAADSSLAMGAGSRLRVSGDFTVDTSNLAPLALNTASVVVFTGSGNQAVGGTNTQTFAFGTVEVQNTAGTSTTTSVRVAASEDDAEQRLDTNAVTLTSTLLDMIRSGASEGNQDQAVGIRFRALQVPQGATIEDARIQFTVGFPTSGVDDTLTLFGESSGNAAVFSTTAGDISGRTKTGSSVSWGPIPNWTGVGDSGVNQRTPNLAAAMSEVIQLGSWSSGNALAFIVTGPSGKRRVAQSYDGSSANAPLLTVTYSTGSVPASAVTVNNRAVSGDDMTARAVTITQGRLSLASGTTLTAGGTDASEVVTVLSAGTLELLGGSLLTLNNTAGAGSPTHTFASGGGRLRLIATGSSSPTLTINGTTNNVSIAGTLETLKTSSSGNPDIAAAGGGGSSFTVSGSLDVDGLDFTGPFGANGLLFTGSGTSATHQLDNVSFSGAADGGRHMTIQSTSLSLFCQNITFTTTHTGSVNVQAEDTSPAAPNGGSDVRLFFAAGDLSTADFATLDGNDRDDLDTDGLLDGDAPANTSVVDWGIAYTRAVDPSEAGSESSGDLGDMRSGIHGSFSLTLNTAASVASPKITGLFPFGPRGYYVGGRGASASPKDDQIVCVELSAGGTIGKRLASYSIPNANGQAVGPPLALILAPGADTPNSAAGNADTDAATVNQVEDVFVGTTEGWLYRVRYDPGASGPRLILCDTLRGSGRAFPIRPLRSPGGTDDLTTRCVEFTSAPIIDVFSPVRLYFGGISGGTDTNKGGGDDAYRIYGIGLNDALAIESPLMYSGSLGVPVRAPFSVLAAGAATSIFAATDEEGGTTGTIIRLESGTAFTTSSTKSTPASGVDDHFRGPTTIGIDGDRVYAGNMNGRVYGRSSASGLATISAYPEEGFVTTGSSAVGGGVALGWDPTPGGLGYAPADNLFFGDDAGNFYGVDGLTGANLGPGFYPVSLDPDGAGARTAAALRSYPLEGPVGASDGSYFYVGSNDGVVFWLAKGNFVAPNWGVYLDLGTGNRLRDVASAFGRLYVPTAKGEVIVVRAKP